MITLLLFICFFIAILLGIPIGVCLGLAALMVMDLIPGAPGIALFSKSAVMGGNSFTLVAVPMFIVAGDIMLAGKLSEKIIGGAARIVGQLSAGLAYVNVLACMFFGAISGSSPATVAAIGANIIPEMVKRGYRRDFSTALTAASGMLGVMIPPSIPLIVYGVSANESIGALFMAGILPGFLFGFFYIAISWYYAKYKPSKVFSADFIENNISNNQINSIYNKMIFHILENKNSSCLSKLTPDFRFFNDNLKVSRIEIESISSNNGLRHSGFWALLIPVIILGGIYSGIFTPTEAAGVAIIYALMISIFVYKNIVLSQLPDILARSSITSVTVMVMVVMAFVFGRLLTIERAPNQIADFISQISNNKIIIILVINLLLLAVGMFMETVAAIIILTPILLPIMIKVGVSPIHFGVILTCNLAIGFCTPPIGVNLFVSSSISGISIEQVARQLMPFLAVMLLSLILVSYIPLISLFLPSLLL